MKAVKGIYENGGIRLLEDAGVSEQVDVMVVFDDRPRDSSGAQSDENRKEILAYFRRRRMEMAPLEGTVKDLVEDGRR
ncbi:MAG: hypothetical protein JW941_12420 [Candidatus Coatesbacteria bacterium]|nr:hypothetical protein [Candidatus Coatesbacteria bacterium]